jgi:hypothetical protein
MRRGLYPGEFLHMDLCGPFPVHGYKGQRYWLMIVDDFTSKRWVDCMESKPEFLPAVQKWFNAVQLPGRRTRRVRIDQSGEGWSSKASEAFWLSRAIEVEVTSSDQHEQAGVVEVAHMIGRYRLQPTMHEHNIPPRFWPIVIKAIVYLLNRSPSRRLETTPEEAWTGHVPDLGHLRVLGSNGYQLRKERQRSKIINHTTEVQLLGYHDNGDYIVRDVRTNNVRRVHDVEFYEAPDPNHRCPFNCAGHRAAESATYKEASRASVNGGATSGRVTVGAGGAVGAKRVMAVTSDSEDDLPLRLRRRPMSGGGEGIDHPLDAPPPLSPAPLSPASDATFHGDPSILDRHPMLSSRTSRNVLPNRYRDDITGADLSNLEEDWALKFAYFTCLIGAANYTTTNETVSEPNTYHQAKRIPSWPQWRTAMKSEYDSLIANGTWILVPRPQDRHVLSGKWVYKLKTGSKGEILRYKARWVARGFEQEAGIDYNETFASVVKPMAYKMLFAIAATLDLEIEQMDVQTAFLYGEIDGDVYMEQPLEFDDGSGRVCKLNKALYGLKQAPRIWYETLKEFLLTEGFKHLESDHGIFVKDGIIMAVYVDDLLLIGQDMSEISKLKQRLSERFDMTDLGPCSYYLGMSIRRDRRKRAIYVSQEAYIDKVLESFDMTQCHSMKIPMDAHERLRAPPEGYMATKQQRHWYASAIGSLMYAMLCTRPDIAYAVSACSRYLANPDVQHVTAVKNVMRYLKGTKHFELVFDGSKIDLCGFSDSDWGGCTDTSRSTGGYLFNLGSGPVSWSSKRQPTTALSSVEAEYYAETQAAKEAIYLRGLLSELGYAKGGSTATSINTGDKRKSSDTQADKHQAPVTINCDNQGAIALAKNPQFHARAKHIRIQWHFVRECVQRGDINLTYVRTGDQLADILTKPLPTPQFAALREAIGIRDPACV